MTDDQPPAAEVRERDKYRSGLARDGSSMDFLADNELLGLAGRRTDIYEMEMQRRLKSAVLDLTAELVTFRESSEAAARKADEAAGRLMRLTGWLIAFTVALVVLTVVVVVLTAYLLQKGKPGP